MATYHDLTAEELVAAYLLASELRMEMAKGEQFNERIMVALDRWKTANDVRFAFVCASSKGSN